MINYPKLLNLIKKLMPEIMVGSRIKHFLSSVDIFGVEPKLNMKQSDKHNSAIGGLVSLVFLGVTIMGILYFGQELIYKKEPSVIETKTHDPEPGRFNLTIDKFNFFIGVSDSNNYFIDPSVYSLSAELAYYHKDNGSKNYTFTSIPLKVEKCSLNRHFSAFKDLFRNDDDLALYQCIDADDSNDLYLQGYKGSDVYVLVRLLIKPCINGTGMVKCKDPDFIESKLKDANAYINFIDTAFNPKLYIEPEEYLKRDLTTTFSTNHLKRLGIYFHNKEYITDGGILIESLEKHTFLEYEYSYEYTSTRNDYDPIFITELRLSNIKYLTYRKYLKIQKFLSEIGGLIKGIMSILQIVIMVFTKTSYFSYLINEIYVYTEHDKHEIQDEPKSSNPLRNKSYIENNYMMNTNGRIISHNIDSIKRFHKAKRKINLTWCEFFKTSILGRFYRFQTSGVKFLRIGKEKIRSNMSIIKLNKLCDEFELLKDVIFDFNGRMLLNYISDFKRIQKARSFNNEIEVSDVILSYGSLSDSNLNNNLKLMFDINFEKGL
jgi:hypothetical protein